MKTFNDQKFGQGRVALLGDVISAKLIINIPQSSWLGKTSKNFSTVHFEILSLMPLEPSEKDKILGQSLQNVVMRIKSVEWMKILEYIAKNSTVVGVYIWEKSEDQVTLAVKCVSSLFAKTILQAECILKYPVIVQNGQGTWQLIAPRTKMDHLLESFDEIGIIYSISSIEGYDMPVSRAGLTKHQQNVFDAALTQGYFDTPRRITLTGLAKKLKLSKSTLSTILRRISRHLAEFK